MTALPPYDKPFHTYQEQIDKLIVRGLEVPDEQLAKTKLRHFGYYRLSGYWYTFRVLKPVEPGDVSRRESRYDHFYQGFTFDHVIELYEFDRQLRILVMDAIERIEVAVRQEVAYTLGEWETFAHTKLATYTRRFTKTDRHNQSSYKTFRKKERNSYQRSSERFVAHFKATYSLPMPIWISVEVWDFGMLSAFIGGVQQRTSDRVAAAFGVPNGKMLQEWLQVLNYVRNISAHHGRLWNRDIKEQLAPRHRGKVPILEHVSGSDQLWHSTANRVYLSLLLMNHLLRVIYPESLWFERVKSLLLSFPDIPMHSVDDMGAPRNWEKSGYWE